MEGKKKFTKYKQSDRKKGNGMKQKRRKGHGEEEARGATGE